MFFSFAIELLQGRQLAQDLVALQAGQALQLHVQDRLRLDLRQPELRDQPGLGFSGILRAADQLDDRIEVIQRDLQAFENVRARFGLAQLELDAPADHVAPEVDEELDHLEQAEHLRPAGDNRQRDDAERLLQLRLLEQVVQHHFGDFAALQLDDDAHAVAIGFVAQIGNAFDRFLADQLGDPLEQARLVQLIRDFGDDDLLAIALLRRFDLGAGAHLDRAAAGEVRLVDAALADDHAAGGEVGAGNQPDQFLELLLARVGR